jgi:signal transduction histidine kinase
MTKEQILASIRLNAFLAEVEAPALEWLMDKSIIRNFQKGEYLFSRGEESLYMHVVLSGRFQIYFEQNGQRVTVGHLDPGAITGVLPYSRMKEATGFGQAQEESEVLSLHRDHFKGMEQVSYTLMQNLVSYMTTRVRDFTAQQQQNEKLISLGKLSAGLAHELNNPSAAMLRSAAALRDHLGHTPERFKAVIKIQMDDHSIDLVNELVFNKLSQDRQGISLMEKSRREDDIVDWMEQHGIAKPYELAESLVSFGIIPSDLEEISNLVPDVHLAVVLRWVENVLTTEQLVSEIEESSRRIAELVSSVKTYSHMDRGLEIEVVDLKAGLRSTITMLGHKIKEKKAEITESYPEKMPEIHGRPGQLNQVWTNVLDNALDAITEGGKIEVAVSTDLACAYVHLIDNGPGVPADIQSKIYDPFFTTKALGKGTGLGLDISMKIIKNHGGNIRLKSQPGRTEFIINLPIQPSTNEQA